MKRWSLVASFVLFIALCVSVAYWAMQLFKPPLRAVAAPQSTTQQVPQLAVAAGLFGGRSTVAMASNYQLQGVVVSGKANESVAILTADGKPPQAVRANGEVMPGVTVKEVHARYVLLSEGGVVKRVELPEDAKNQVKMDAATNTPMPSRAVPMPTQTPAPVPPTVVINPAPAPAGQIAPGMGGVPAQPPGMPQLPGSSPAGTPPQR